MNVERKGHEMKFILSGMTSHAPVRARNLIIDAMRGAAIILMVIDHSLAALESTGLFNIIVEYSRLTITRVSMPLFMIASGIVWTLYGLRLRRWFQVLLLAAALNAMTRVLWPDFNFPEILLVWAMLALFWKLIRRFPVLTLIIGFIQNTYWQVYWQAYQPGELAIFLAVGVLVARAPLEQLSNLRQVSKARGIINACAKVGQYPLTIYGTHLAILAVLVASANNRLPLP
ncbi:MAG: DUF1624 domain-containing protein [Actinobacteria bacterium]|nr:DUF1624 domain-containing protein [Actinomycetota bacterium]